MNVPRPLHQLASADDNIEIGRRPKKHFLTQSFLSLYLSLYLYCRSTVFATVILALHLFITFLLHVPAFIFVLVAFITIIIIREKKQRRNRVDLDVT